MARQDIERQKNLEPERMQFAKRQIENLGLPILDETDTTIKFLFKGGTVTYFPYSGWATGTSIVDGRGWNKLYSQIKVK